MATREARATSWSRRRRSTRGSRASRGSFSSYMRLTCRAGAPRVLAHIKVRHLCTHHLHVHHGISSIKMQSRIRYDRAHAGWVTPPRPTLVPLALYSIYMYTALRRPVPLSTSQARTRHARTSFRHRADRSHTRDTRHTSHIKRRSPVIIVLHC